MTQNTALEYPKTGSILALIGGVLIMLGGVLFLFVSAVIIPHVNFGNFTTPPNFSSANVSSIASGVVGTMGAFGLVCGIIVLLCAVLLLANLGQPRTWGVIMLIFVVGAVLGIIGSVLTLRWKPPTH
jgi:hypothetical protein